MTTMEAVVAIIVGLFVAGGPASVYINARAAKKASISTDQAENNAIDNLAADLGIDERWRKYADELEDRLDERIARLEASLSAARRTTDIALAYAEVLRGHIQNRFPPPPPPWPQDIT